MQTPASPATTGPFSLALRDALLLLDGVTARTRQRPDAWGDARRTADWALALPLDATWSYFAPIFRRSATACGLFMEQAVERQRWEWATRILELPAREGPTQKQREMVLHRALDDAPLSDFQRLLDSSRLEASALGGVLLQAARHPNPQPFDHLIQRGVRPSVRAVLKAARRGLETALERLCAVSPDQAQRAASELSKHVIKQAREENLRWPLGIEQSANNAERDFQALLCLAAWIGTGDQNDLLQVLPAAAQQQLSQALERNWRQTVPGAPAARVRSRL